MASRLFSAAGGGSSGRESPKCRTSPHQHAFSERHTSSVEHMRQSWPDSGLGFQVKVLKTLEVVPTSPGSGYSVVPHTTHIRWFGLNSVQIKTVKAKFQRCLEPFSVRQSSQPSGVPSPLESGYVSTRGPSWGHPRVVLGAVGPFLEPFVKF